MLPMDYPAVVEHLYALGHELARTPAHKFDLAHMRTLATALGDPQTAFASVLVAGTNGKGSTAATLASILTAAGHRTGLYTSPHLVRVNERIRINGEPISDADFAAAFDRVDAVAQESVRDRRLPQHPSFFETLTAMAFQHFHDAAAKIAVLEVGMGGRLDATNVAEPIVSVITDIALDHQKYLGDTVVAIAGEKAGIVRGGRPTVTLPQHPEANDVLGRAILDRGARGVNASQYVPPVSPGFEQVWQPGARNRYPLSVMGAEITVDSPLVGRHQLRNIALAIAAAEEVNAAGFKVTAHDIEAGIRDTSWPGRFQVAHPLGWPEMVFDVAHNPAGAWALRAALSERFEGRPLFLVFGAMRDKAIGEIAEILFPMAERVIATHAEGNPRAASPQEIRQAAARAPVEIEEAPRVADAIVRAREAAGENGVVVVTGSIYVVGEVMTIVGL